MSLRVFAIATGGTAALVAALALAAPRGATKAASGPAMPASGCASFDFPVGAPDALGYYDAQPFGGARAHLGNDWNGVRGANSDLGDPVSSIADGVVSEASDHGGGWGNVVRVVHACADGDNNQVESLYAHLESITVAPGDVVTRGQKLGTIGTAGGVYSAHLHLELRDRPGLPLGPGYGRDLHGYLDPTRFILQHRPR